jgi:hypothetical protein
MLKFKDGHVVKTNQPIRFCDVKISFQLTKDTMVNAVCRMLLERAEWDGDNVSNIDDLRKPITKKGIEEYVRSELGTSGMNRFWFDIFDQFVSDESRDLITEMAESICSDFYGL